MKKQLSPKTQFLMLFVGYSVLIFGVFYGSGLSREKTLYDRYNVDFDGTYLPSSDRERSSNFYSKVLDFQPLFNDKGDGKRIVALVVPGNKKLFLADRTPGSQSVAIYVRVRNGFEALHRALEKRIANDAKESGDTGNLPRISEIETEAWGSKFTVVDHDSNLVTFFKPLRRTGQPF